MTRPRNNILLVGLMIAGFFSAARANPNAPLPDKVDFNRDIRPILSDNCFFCHGPDKAHRKADLRLDTPEGLSGDLGGYAATVPGDPGKSELFRRITTDNTDDLMPPPDSNKKLSPRDVALVKKWIEQGAEFKGHWAYILPTRPPVPKAQTPGFTQNDIDRFILARLEAEGLKPSPRADRATLARRVSFDLTGLPPDSEQVRAFVADTRPDAYERFVDELLASVHYGERMASWWLDLVRFADTVGYHGDRPMHIYPYRDYVINALNNNYTFDRFTAEQLAGDLLPNPTMEQHIASGYNRLALMSEEGGVQEKEYQARTYADRVRNLGSAFLGATTACHECHDHKFDPLLASDFYRLAAFFSDIKEPGHYVGRVVVDGIWGEFMRVPSDEQAASLADYDAKLAAVQKTLDTQTPDLDRDMEQWAQAVKPAEWTPLQLVEAQSEGIELQSQEDGAIKAVKGNPDKAVYTLKFMTSLKGITAFRLEALTDPGLPRKGPGRSPMGNFVVGTFEVLNGETPVQLKDATATFEQADWHVAKAIDTDPKTGWAIAPEMGKDHAAVFQTVAPVGEGTEASLTVRIHQELGGNHTLGRFRISATTHTQPVTVNGMPDDVQKIIATDPAQRTAEQKTQLAAYYRTVSPRLKEPRQEAAALRENRKKLEDSIPITLVTVTDSPKTVRVLPRGDWMNESGPVVEPGVPAFLPQIEKEGRATRLDLARWLTSDKNPLTSRVMVNHFWKLCFGEGLCRSMADFGAQGESPDHPELLDYLAIEFQESAWDIKHMMKLIVMSGAYQQSSEVSPGLLERDPFNRLLARQSRFRMDAEMVRDNALAVSGLLVRKVGGPSAKPYQPAKYYAFLNFPPREYQADKGEGLYRRAVYTWWQRQYLHPSLLAFDAPSREECTAQRTRANIPQQGLTLLNDPTYVEAARVLAEKAIRQGGKEAESRIDYIFQNTLLRSPKPAERQLLTALQREHAEQFANDETAAREFTAVGEWPVPQDISPAELASWTTVTRVVFNLYETVSRY